MQKIDAGCTVTFRNVEFLPNDKEDRTCHICYEVLDAQKKKLIGHFNKNSHIYHEECLLSWLENRRKCQEKPTCPDCRDQVFLDIKPITPEQRSIELTNVVYLRKFEATNSFLHQGPIPMDNLKGALLLASFDVDPEKKKDEPVRQALVTFAKRFYPTQPEILAMVVKKKLISLEEQEQIARNAVLENRPEILETLIKYGHKVSEKFLKDFIQEASTHNHPKIFAILCCENPDQDTLGKALRTSASYGHQEIFNQLLEKHLDRISPDDLRLAIEAAIKHNNLAIIKAITNKAQIGQEILNPLIDMAKLNDREEAAKILISYEKMDISPFLAKRRSEEILQLAKLQNGLEAIQKEVAQRGPILTNYLDKAVESAAILNKEREIDRLLACGNLSKRGRTTAVQATTSPYILNALLKTGPIPQEDQYKIAKSFILCGERQKLEVLLKRCEAISTEFFPEYMEDAIIAGSPEMLEMLLFHLQQFDPNLLDRLRKDLPLTVCASKFHDKILKILAYYKIKTI